MSRVPPERNPKLYSVLGLRHGASIDEVKKAYKALALQHHPDRNIGVSGADDRFKELVESYQLLSNVSSKEAYDTLFAMDAGPSTAYRNATTPSGRKSATWGSSMYGSASAAGNGAAAAQEDLNNLRAKRQPRGASAHSRTPATKFTPEQQEYFKQRDRERRRELLKKLEREKQDANEKLLNQIRQEQDGRAARDVPPDVPLWGSSSSCGPQVERCAPTPATPRAARPNPYAPIPRAAVRTEPADKPKPDSGLSYDTRISALYAKAATENAQRAERSATEALERDVSETCSSVLLAKMSDLCQSETQERAHSIVREEEFERRCVVSFCQRSEVAVQSRLSARRLVSAVEPEARAVILRLEACTMQCLALVAEESRARSRTIAAEREMRTGLCSHANSNRQSIQLQLQTRASTSKEMLQTVSALFSNTLVERQRMEIEFLVEPVSRTSLCAAIVARRSQQFAFVVDALARELTMGRSFVSHREAVLQDESAAWQQLLLQAHEDRQRAVLAGHQRNEAQSLEAVRASTMRGLFAMFHRDMCTVLGRHKALAEECAALRLEKEDLQRALCSQRGPSAGRPSRAAVADLSPASQRRTASASSSSAGVFSKVGATFERPMRLPARNKSPQRSVGDGGTVVAALESVASRRSDSSLRSQDPPEAVPRQDHRIRYTVARRVGV